MTGEDIKKLRELLGMGVPQFAQLLGVNAATAYRWEMVGGKTVTLDPLHASLLTRLDQSVASKTTRAEREAWAKKLLGGVLVGGTLVGLAILLAELLPPERDKAKK